MKYCPQCNKQFSEPWISFCSEDGTMLIEQLSPPADPNFDPQIRGPKTESASEQETQWLPREPPAWVAPDERPPMSPAPWQQQPAEWQTAPASKPTRATWQPPPPPLAQPKKQPGQGLALASMIVAIVGLLGGTCFGPIPGIVALILGVVALQQISKGPDKTTGKPYAVAGVIISGLTIAFYLLLLIWFLLALVFGKS
jgi:hypothetical protein